MSSRIKHLYPLQSQLQLLMWHHICVNVFTLKKFFYSCICLLIHSFWLCQIFVEVLRLSLVVRATLGCSVWAPHCSGFSLQSMGSRCSGFSSCSTQAQQLWCAALGCMAFSGWSTGISLVALPGSREWAQQLWHMSLVAPQYLESSQSRDRTHVPCIGRQIPNHWTTRKVPQSILTKVYDMNPAMMNSSVSPPLLPPSSYQTQVLKETPGNR